MSYGQDTWCGERLVTGRLARGAQVVILALYRRLITPRGTLRGGDDEDAYGIDLAGYIGAVGYDNAVAAIPGIIRSEFLKDARVADVSIDATITREANTAISIVLDCVITLVDSDEEFPFSVAASATSVTLLGVPEA
jgi:hypothetical protein